MDNSADPAHPVTELEVFIGNILGKTGAATKPQREKSKTMKDQFEEHSVFIADWILKHGPGGHENALARCMACVATSLEDFPPFPKHGHIHSFKYAAAGLCWKEIDRLSL